MIGLYVGYTHDRSHRGFLVNHIMYSMTPINFIDNRRVLLEIVVWSSPFGNSFWGCVSSVFRSIWGLESPKCKDSRLQNGDSYLGYDNSRGLLFPPLTSFLSSFPSSFLSSFFFFLVNDSSYICGGSGIGPCDGWSWLSTGQHLDSLRRQVSNHACELPTVG